MPPTLEAMNDNTVNGHAINGNTMNDDTVVNLQRKYGLHEWNDPYGNPGVEVLSQHNLRLHAVRANGLFRLGNEKTRINLADYFNPTGISKRRAFVVVDSRLSEDEKRQIENYFIWCKTEKLVEKYEIILFAANKTEKTLEKVVAIAATAKQFGIRRRDLFVAIGGTMVLDVVGFVAAIYRRAVPYISVPTDLVGIIRCYDGNHKVSLYHMKKDGETYRGLLALPHLPIVSFYDPSFLHPLCQDEISRGLVEIVKIAVVKDIALLSYVEEHLEKMLTGTQGGYLMTATEVAARAASEEFTRDLWGRGTHLLTAKFGDEAAQAIEQIKGITYDETVSVAIGVALMSALSFCKGNLNGTDLGRVLNVLQKATLPIYDETLEADTLWNRIIGAIEGRGGDSAVVVPMALGRGGYLDFAEISAKDISVVLNILRECNNCPQTIGRPHDLETATLTKEILTADQDLYEWTASEDVQYHVASVQEIFGRDNPTIIQDYCFHDPDGRKKKVLIVVDDYEGNALSDISKYFQTYRSDIDDFAILSVQTSSKCKDIDSTLRVINAALKLGMSQRDLFMVVGGGTIMDTVGFAAAIYRGGTRYVKIPTTLLGMIDAGIAVKVGVNVGDHKNFIGRYYAPVACLNDPATFLVTLPQREFACGLAEAIKMAVLKSPRLFGLIARHYGNVKYNAYTDEVIQISIYTMLEELQPNLTEQSLKRLVDFGHEFGHIVESLSSYELRHGECVSIGMAISSYLAYLKGIISRTDLERILYLCLEIGLPIYVTDYDCCNPSVLWAKICKDGIEHKDGMLYLVVPETIGRAGFLDDISDIDDDMVRETVLGLRRYADWHAGKNSLKNGFHYANLSAARGDLIFENSKPRRNYGILSPNDVYLPLEISKTRTKLEEGLAKLCAALQKTMIFNGIQDETAVILLPPNEWHITVVSFSQDDISSFELLPKSKIPIAQAVISRFAVFKGSVKGVYINGAGFILAQTVTDAYPFKALGSDLVSALGISAAQMNPNPCVTLGRILPNVRFSTPEALMIQGVIDRELFDYNFGELTISRALGLAGQEFLFTADKSSVLNSLTSPTATAAIIGASGDIGSQLADYLVRNDMRVICSVRYASLQKFKTRMKFTDPNMRVLTGDVLDLANLRVIIQDADILYNMAGIVTLSAEPGDFAKVIAFNGFAQGIITHFIQQMKRDRHIKVIFPSTQRIHLTSAKKSVDKWIHEAAEAFSARQDALISEQDIYSALEIFAEQFIASHPLPAGFNVYEISKRLGEHFLSLLPRHSLVRISSVYGPTFTKGFVHRAVSPKPEGNVEAREKGDFVYIDDLNELLLKAATSQTAENEVFDVVSGESIDKQEVWGMVRELIGDRAPLVLKGDGAMEEIKPDPTWARRLLGRDFTPMRLGLRKTIDALVQSSHLAKPIMCLQYPESFMHMADGACALEKSLMFTQSGNRFSTHAEVSSITNALEQSLNNWFNKLPTSHQQVLTEYVSLMGGLPIRLRTDAAMTQLGEFTINGNEHDGYQGVIDLHASFAAKACHTGDQEKIDDVVGHEGYHLLAFLLRGRKPLLSDREQEREEAMAQKWQEFLIRHEKPHVLTVDVGATYLRIGILSPNGLLLAEPTRILTPSKQSYPRDTLAQLQERLVETLVCKIDSVRANHTNFSLEEVGISFGAVVTNDGILEDASIIWGDTARGYNLKDALQSRLPGVQLTILNDVSAAAWRYKDEGRFCLITVSSGLSNKVFNSDLRTFDKLDLDAAGVGGEMGHVVVEPRAVDALVRHAIMQAVAHPEEFKHSQLNILAHGDAQKINARYLGLAAKEGDIFALHLLEETDVPYCSCGNLADLCSYSSGRGALQLAKRHAARGQYNIVSDEVTDQWLKEAIMIGHPLALKVLYDSTYPLALRILQLAADIGLDKFVIVGGFAMKTGKGAYLQALQDHLVRFCHNSAFFAQWTEDKVRGLLKFGVGDDNDGLIGMGYFVQHLRTQYHAIEKAVGESSLALVTRSIPRCGAREVLAKVIFSGICTTDLQILRAERGLEPTVLGHEGVCQVVEVGKDVRGVSLGSLIVLNPNNPLDDHEKLGHTYEGVFQQFYKFGQEFLDRKQVLVLEDSTADATDTLIEPLSCVLAAQERIKNRIAGKNVLVVGAGVMGLLFVMMNVKYGARNVFLTNRSRSKLDYAVEKGVVQHNKVFAIGESVASQVAQVSAGEGIDIVIISVSMGQGVSAAQDAANYVNAGGCVYLFAGFRSGDALILDGGEQVDLWSIRSGWKTQRIQITGKPVDLSGHRGCSQGDLATAASLIRGDRLSFGKVISHIVSLDSLPEIMPTLTQNGNILGMSPKRVIVDMGTRDRVVQFAAELPLRHLHEATRKRKDEISKGNLFREIGFEGGTSMLGWVCPPAWQEVKMTLEVALQTKAMTSKRDFIFCGTGGWVFLVDALKEIIPASQDIKIHTVQSLDPQTLADLFSNIQHISGAVCLGISQSGRTVETVKLMNALRERFDSAGLDYREYFIWLTDSCHSIHDSKNGEATIRASKEHDWSDVDIVPLTVRNHSDINALFCAPHSVVMFLALLLLLRKRTEELRHMYQQYLALREGVVHSIIPKAESVASNNIELIQLNLDERIAPVMTKLVTQLIAQALGSKLAGFNPRVRVASSGQSAGFEHVALPMPAETPAVVKVMLTMNALAVFVAIVAYHRRITFVTHPKVNLYKRRAAELMAVTAADVENSVSDFGPISAGILAYLDNNRRTRFVELMCYGQTLVSHQQSVRDELTSSLGPKNPNISIEVTHGEAWNHSKYQAAVQTEDTLYVILVWQKFCSEVEGISNETLVANIRMLQGIARATYETLSAKALHFRIGEGIFG